jgi:hypothetical protein
VGKSAFLIGKRVKMGVFDGKTGVFVWEIIKMAFFIKTNRQFWVEKVSKWRFCNQKSVKMAILDRKSVKMVLLNQKMVKMGYY